MGYRDVMWSCGYGWGRLILRGDRGLDLQGDVDSLEAMRVSDSVYSCATAVSGAMCCVLRPRLIGYGIFVVALFCLFLHGGILASV